jgi:GNAT superfamily N-acetyltransferase
LEAAVEIRTARAPGDIAQATLIDEALLGSDERAVYIDSVAGAGGLSVVEVHGEIRGFCCLDHKYFFEKPFISLLVIMPDARRLGLGGALISWCSSAHPEVWTSTNTSNAAMRGLLAKLRWQYCGEVCGLDDGDPEMFFKTG